MTVRQVDFLIVGLGLAGGLLAWELAREGADFLVVDDGRAGSASRAAAGLVTPVTGQRLALQEDAEGLLAAASALYGELAGRLGRQWFHPLPVLRLITGSGQQDYLARRRCDPAYADFLGSDASAGDLAALDAPLGAVWLRHTGYLDTVGLLDGLRTWLHDQGRLHDIRFDTADLHRQATALRWGNITARRLVFCEGSGALRNPWFRHLPWQMAKGEILSVLVEHRKPLPDAIVNWGHWLAPRPDGSFRLGATHVWTPLDGKTTASARTRLLDSLASRLPGARTRVLAQVSGIRPATRDRRPFLGDHPSIPGLSVFNGFGAKGSLLIPWHARRMAAHLCSGEPLPPSADIARHA